MTQFLNDPILDSIRSKYSVNNSLPLDPFFSLVESIISQQLSVKASDTIVKRFVALFPDNTVTATQILAIPLETFRSVGMSWSKAQYVKNIAQAAAEGCLDFKTMETLSDEEVIAELVKIKGIGKWTAEMFLIFTLGRSDVFSYGDIGLQNAIQKLYNLKQKPTQTQMKRLSNKWKPYRSYACKLLWKSLDNQ